jgi:ABC-type lipoprotein export system ATPase subunit
MAAVNAQAGTQAQPAERLVEVRDLGHVYSTGDEIVVALRGIELELNAGERLAVTGRSGSGKTTLLRILAALETPTRGDVVVAGQDVVAMTRRQRQEYRRRTVGYVWQEPETGLREEQVGTALGILGIMKLDSRLDDRPPQLTAAETQRLALAVALANGPRLLLADELTAGLEWPAAHELIADLYAALSRGGTAAIIVTHDARLQAHVDRWIRLRDGAILKARD